MMHRSLVGDLVDRALAASPPNRDEALGVLQVADSDTVSLVAEVARVRRHFFQDRVKLNFLLNIKSGLCPEDCHYCSQSKLSTAQIPRYSMLPPETAVEAATIAVGVGAKRFCMVASGRGPSQSELRRFIVAVRAVKQAHPNLEICACLGLLTDGQGEQLRAAGVFAYNHNLNTSQDHYASICSTHEFADRKQTVRRAKASGLSPCSGVLFGMGETDEDIVDVGFALRELEPDSVPVNFLIPIHGTPLAGVYELTPLKCLRILALYRLLFPNVEVRIAGGREVHLRTLQAFGLQLANSIFAGDYLTTKGQAASADLDLIADCGLRVETSDEITLPHSRLGPVELKKSALE
jgi:biotin synthase